MTKHEDDEAERIKEAYRIVSSYGTVLERGTDGEMARRISWLPCSILKIRISFCIVVEHKIKVGNNKLLNKDFELLISGIRGLNSFIMDKDVDRLKEIENKPKNSWTKEDEYYFREFLSQDSEKEADEFASYVNELLGRRTYDDHILFPYIENLKK